MGTLSRAPLCCAVIAVAALLVAGCGTSVAGSGATVSGAAGTIAAETYCTDKGGALVDRVATWNTNGDPSTWLELAGRLRLCEFEDGSGDSTTRISVDPTTLSSEKPTLAALAYLSSVPTSQPPQVGQNPASFSCTNDVAGTSAFGNASAAGGGWVDASQPVFVVMNLCVFADGSAIDEFGLWYHANGTIRGADLAPLFRYQPGDRTPAIYEPGR